MVENKYRRKETVYEIWLPRMKVSDKKRGSRDKVLVLSLLAVVVKKRKCGGSVGLSRVG